MTSVNSLTEATNAESGAVSSTLDLAKRLGTETPPAIAMLDAADAIRELLHDPAAHEDLTGSLKLRAKAIAEICGVVEEVYARHSVSTILEEKGPQAIPQFEGEIALLSGFIDAARVLPCTNMEEGSRILQLPNYDRVLGADLMSKVCYPKSWGVSELPSIPADYEAWKAALIAKLEEKVSWCRQCITTIREHSQA